MARRPVLLLIEDSPEFAFLVARLAERAGCALTSCGNLQSAREQIRKELPDLVLLDRNLAGQDGLDLVRHLRHTQTPVPVALFCHSSVSADQAEALEAGVDFFFLKDLVSDQAGWERRLHEILARAPGRHGGEPLESPIHGDTAAPALGGAGTREGAVFPEPKPHGIPDHPLGEGGSPGTEAGMYADKETTSRWVTSLGVALRHPSLREIGPEVLQALLRRGLLYAFEFRSPDRQPEVDAVLGHGIDLDRIGAVCSSAEAGRLLAFLADRIACLLGSEPAAAFRQTMGLEILTHLPGLPASPSSLLSQGNVRPAPPSPGRGDSCRVGGQTPCETAAPTRRHTRHALLLVEDNEPEVEITQRAIRESALPVDLFVVRDGQEAIDYLLRQGWYAPSPAQAWRFPDLILLDLNLPRLSGREVLQRIRSGGPLPTVPVVVLSHSPRPEDVRDLYALGANTYIEKPRDFARFVEVMRTIHHYWLGMALLPAPP